MLARQQDDQRGDELTAHLFCAFEGERLERRTRTRLKFEVSRVSEEDTSRDELRESRGGARRTKNFELNSTQCSRSACKNADKPSITHKLFTVSRLVSCFVPENPDRTQRERPDDLHRDGEREPHGEHGDEERDGKDALHLERALDGHVPQHFGELCVSERKGPESQVRGRVGDATEAELDRVCTERVRVSLSE